MDAGGVIWIVCCWGCAGLFLGFALYMLKLKTPTNFWSGTIVKSEEVTDVKAYNKENSIMWSVYSIPFWICGLTGIININVALVIMILACSLGIVLLIINYKRIQRKYFI